MTGRITIGGYEVTPLLDGVQDLESAGGIVDFFASPSNDVWDPYRRRYPGLFATNGGWRLHVRAFLIRGERRTILFDTGVGPSTAPASEWFGTPGSLPERLGATGVAASDVDTVVLSHVHDDHLGGTCRADGTPAFPNARYLLHAADAAWLRSNAEIDDEDRAIKTLLLDPIVASGQLVEIDDRFDVAAGIRTRHLPGHTPGHQGLQLGAADDGLLLSGDAFNHPAQLDRPEWAGGSDADPAAASQRRRELLAELVDTGRLLAAVHFEESFGRVVTDGHMVVWQPE